MSHSSVDWKSKVRMPLWSGFGESPLSGCGLPSSLCVLPDMVEGLGALRDLFYKRANLMQEGSTVMT